MKKLLFIAVAFSLIFGSINATAKTIEASNTIATRVYEIKDVKSLTVNGGFYVEYVYGEPEIKVVAPDNVIPLMDITSDKGKVTLGYKNNTNISFRLNKKVKIYVSSNQLYSVVLNGSGDIIVNSQLKENSFSAVLNGSGDIKIDNILCVNNCNISLNGSGDIALQTIKTANATYLINGSGDMKIGNSSSLEAKVEVNGSGEMKIATIMANSNVKLQGSGDLIIQNLRGHVCNANLYGSGDLEIHNILSKEVDVNLGGSGNIKLSGIADKATYSITNSGDIDAYDLKAVDVIASVKGSGTINCFAGNSLKKRIIGMGDVKYKGNPSIK
ncbi:MAG: DUF2807 domain-containing protein [Muribaculaceae bacterium]|nr:DUF2807 domain-containing protein [Muribaculaceae bacterium]